MNKSNTILQITSEVLDRYRNSISRKAFIQAMERVIELVLGPLSGACPPFQQAKADFDCREFDCQTCWQSWLESGKPPVKEDNQ